MYSSIGNFFKKYEKEGYNVKENFQRNIETNNANPKKEESNASPSVWGPPFWFSLHVSSLYYPEEASPIVRERMNNRILAIPYEIPCSLCRPHASAHIEKHKDKLNDIVKGRDNLFKFYVDFHNAVNQRYNKKIWSYDEAKAYYSKK